MCPFRFINGHFFKLKIEKDIYAIGGKTLLRNKYDGTVYTLLSTVYPEYDWLPWKFHRTSRNTWKEQETTRKFLEWAGNQLGVKELSDWYKVSKKVYFK